MSAFNLQPTLTDGSVHLHPLRAEDFEALYAVAADPLVWEQHPNPTRYQRPVFETFFAGAMESGGAFLITDAASGAVIGSSRFYDYDPARATVLIGYSFLARSHWGGPTNRAVKALLLDYAFAHGIEDVIFHVGAQNRRSQRAMEKLGAEKTAEQEVAYHGEPPKLNFIYRIRRGAWPA
jgi:N-acetyltransferase